MEGDSFSFAKITYPAIANLRSNFELTYPELLNLPIDRPYFHNEKDIRLFIGCFDQLFKCDFMQPMHYETLTLTKQQVSAFSNGMNDILNQTFPSMKGVNERDQLCSPLRFYMNFCTSGKLKPIFINDLFMSIQHFMLMSSGDNYDCVNSFWYYCNSLVKIENSQNYVHWPSLNKDLHIIIFSVEDLIKETIGIQKLPGNTEDRLMAFQILEANIKYSQDHRVELCPSDTLDLTAKVNILDATDDNTMVSCSTQTQILSTISSRLFPGFAFIYRIVNTFFFR